MHPFPHHHVASAQARSAGSERRYIRFFDEIEASDVPGVRKMLQLAVEGCRRNGRHSGICGQPPADYPEIAAELVRLGIGSISVNPDVIIRTTMSVLALERELDAGVQPAPRGERAVA